MNTECFRIGGVVLNAGTKEVTRQGELIPLPPLSFNLLHVLARHAPNVVTAHQLEEEVWSGLVVDRGTINKRVLLVRNALREAGCADNYITVIRGTGYRLAVPVERLPDCIDCADLPVNEPDPDKAEKSPTSWRTFAASGLVIVAFLVSFALKDYRGTEGQDEPAGPPLKPMQVFSAAQKVAIRPSLAVLPFEDLGDAGVDAFLGDGIAREITSLLSTIPELDVASSTSSFSFRDSQEPVSSVAAQLKVDTVLRGSIQRFGDRMHIVTRLVDAKSGEQLWSASYGGNLDEVFLVQDEIASNVAMALQVQLGEEESRSRQGSTDDVKAFTHFLKGRALIDNRISLGADGLRQAMDQFKAAIEIDSGFDRAHVGVASTHYLLPAYDSSANLALNLELAEASARFALELNPASSEALGVLGAIMFRRGEPAQAAALFQRSLELGNSDPDILHWHALLFTSMGYFEDLLPGLEDAYRLDPLNPLLGCSLAGTLALSGQPEASVAVFSSVTEFSRRDLGLALASMYIGDFETARKLLREVELWTGVLPAHYSDQLVTAFEDPMRYQTVESTFVEAARSGELSDLLAFEALLIMGSPEAFDLEVDITGTAFEYRLPEPVWNNWGFKLRRDPRFKNWIRALGYDQYWRKNGWPDRCRPTSPEDFECV